MKCFDSKRCKYVPFVTVVCYLQTILTEDVATSLTLCLSEMMTRILMVGMGICE